MTQVEIRLACVRLAIEGHPLTPSTTADFRAGEIVKAAKVIEEYVREPLKMAPVA